jgi:hypothetical protein
MRCLIINVAFILTFFIFARTFSPAIEPSEIAVEQLQKNEIRTLKLVETMRINDGDEFFFKAPLQTVIAPDGSIIVNEGKKIYKFDSQGEFIEDLFREGEGPGEMKEIGSILIIANRIIVYEKTKNKIIELDMDGDLIQEQKLEKKRFTDVLAYYKDKYYFVDWIPQEYKGKEGIISINHNLYIVDKDGAANKSGLNFPTMTSIVRGRGYTGYQIINKLKWASSNSRFLYICHTPDYSIKLLDLMDMEIVSVLKRVYESIRVDDSDERKKWYPVEFHNDIQKLLLHKTNLWVVTSTIQKNKGILVDVYSSTGNLIDNFYLPIEYSRPGGSLFWSMTISDDDLFVFKENEDNTLSLVKYNIPATLK